MSKGKLGAMLTSVFRWLRTESQPLAVIVLCIGMIAFGTSNHDKLNHQLRTDQKAYTNNLQSLRSNAPSDHGTPLGSIQVNRKVVSKQPGQKPQTLKSSEFDLEVRTVEAAEEAALWTRYGVYATTAGLIGVISTMLVSIWQGALARRAYISTARPRLRIEQIYGLEFLPNEPLKMRVIAYNIGETTAAMRRMEVRISCKKDGVQTSVGHYERNLSDKLPPSKMLDYNNLRVSAVIPAILYQEVFNRVAHLYFEIVLHYRDANKVERSTGEMRAYNVDRGVFEKVTDPELAHHTFEH